MTYMELEFPGDADEARVRSRRNISDADRWLSIAAGTGLALYGLSRRKSAGWFLAAMGGMLLQRGGSGHCHTYEAARHQHRGNRGRHPPRAQRFGGHARRRKRHDQPADRRALPLLAEPREPAAVHAPSRIGRDASPTRCRAGGPSGPGGKIVEWNAEIINEVPNKVIGWRSIEGSDVVSAGSVNFNDVGPGRGTRVQVHLQYSPPGGKVGAAVAGCSAATRPRRSARTCGASSRSSRRGRFLRRNDRG